MPKFIEFGLIISAVFAVAIADVVLKRAADTESFLQAIKSPWMVGALVLYFVQIMFITYAFVIGWELSILGTLQVVCYALVVVVVGVFYFREQLTPTQVVGLVMAVGGSLLISSK